ncbi:hypothetical protein E2C01_035732 [Portunus trituberculatus]|uniref:Uncharacterized protein n=1 Tax=Portunus trituberculatus TaxID=210409 RepID=A0A5B7FA45_PORTR|nr:hypothetical protein [Portunus trituberculatus]
MEVGMMGRHKCVCTFSGVEAHMTIASEVIPRILAGLRLHSSTAILFCISSTGMNLTKPDTTVLFFSSPTSTWDEKVEVYSLLGEGDGAALTCLTLHTPRSITTPTCWLRRSIICSACTAFCSSLLRSSCEAMVGQISLSSVLAATT